MSKEKVLYSCYLENFKCKYYITKSIKTFSDNKNKIITYGVKIDLVNHNSIKEQAILKEVGINENDVKEYITNLYNRQVTPKALKHIATNI
ncbi:MAG: hypothetical protein IKV94_03370 [Clostridia bacterium]|nr:hypothetical protein [Clostridia bacterium]